MLETLWVSVVSLLKRIPIVAILMGLVISTSFILFSNSDTLEFIGISAWAIESRSSLGFIFIFSLKLLLAIFIKHVWHFFVKILQKIAEILGKRSVLKKQVEILKKLRPDEIKILNPYIVEEMTSQYLSLSRWHCG